MKLIECKCSASNPCPQGRVGSMPRCKIWVESTLEFPKPAPVIWAYVHGNGDLANATADPSTAEKWKDQLGFGKYVLWRG